jgi:hypothetical protein
LKIVLNFFLSNEVISLGFNLFCGVGGFIHIFSLWHWRFEKGDAIVNHVGFHSLRNYFVATLALGLRPKQGPTKVWTKVSPGVTFHVLGSARECEGMNPHTPKWAPTLGVGVPMDSRIFKGWLQGSKLIGLRSSLYH